jgi:hypothetical protein
VEFEEGERQEFSAGRAFLQTRAKWHRGRNQGKGLVRFLAVFCGARDVPNILHPPGRANERRSGSKPSRR